MQSVQWPMRKKLRLIPELLIKAMALTIFAGVFAVAAFYIYQSAYTRGMNHGYNFGYQDGKHSSCQLAVDWARWSINAESDMVKSQHYTQATGNEVIQDTNAGYARVCGVVLPTPNIYDPNSKPVAVPLNKTPTLPLGHDKLLRRIP